MTATEDLYHEEVLHHATNPSNYGVLANPSSIATGHNPLCGDKVTVSILVDGNTVSDVRFEGSGCAISQAAASMMTGLIKGKTIPEVSKLSEKFRAALTNPTEESAWDEDLQTLVSLRGVQKFPIRVKCATLAWHALSQAVAKFL